MRGRPNVSSSRVGQLKFATDGPTPITCLNQSAQLCTSLAPGQRKLTELFAAPTASNRSLQMTTTPKNSNSLRSSLLLGLNDTISETPATPASSAKTPMMPTLASRICEEVDSDDFFESAETDQPTASGQHDGISGSARKARSKLQLRRRDSNCAVSRSNYADSDSGTGSQSPSGNRLVGVRNVEPSDSQRQLRELNNTSPISKQDDLNRSGLTADVISPSRIVASAIERKPDNAPEASPPSSPILGPSRPSSLTLQRRTMPLLGDLGGIQEEPPSLQSTGTVPKVERRPVNEKSSAVPSRRRARQLEGSSDEGEGNGPASLPSAISGRAVPPPKSSGRAPPGRETRRRTLAEDIESSDDDCAAGPALNGPQDKGLRSMAGGRSAEVEIDLANSSEDERGSISCERWARRGTASAAAEQGMGSCGPNPSARPVLNVVSEGKRIFSSS